MITTSLTIIFFWILSGIPLFYCYIKDEMKYTDITVGDLIMMAIFAGFAGPVGFLFAIWRIFNLRNVLEIVVFKKTPYKEVVLKKRAVPKIFSINNKDFQSYDETITHERICELAEKPTSASVVYRGPLGNGSLMPDEITYKGKSVPLVHGMIFSCVNTGNA